MIKKSYQLFFDLITGKYKLETTIMKFDEQKNQMKKYMKFHKNIVKKFLISKKIKEASENIVNILQEPQNIDISFQAIMEEVSKVIDPLQKILVFAKPIMKTQLPPDVYERTLEEVPNLIN